MNIIAFCLSDDIKRFNCHEWISSTFLPDLFLLKKIDAFFLMAHGIWQTQLALYGEVFAKQSVPISFRLVKKVW